MSRVVSPELTQTWVTVLASYDGIERSTAEMLAARIAGDYRIASERVSMQADIEPMLDTVETVIDEVDLSNPLADAGEADAVREELLSVLRADLEDRIHEETPATDVDTTASQLGFGAVTQESDAGTGDDRPRNAAELYEYLTDLDFDQEDIEAVLEDIRANAEDD